MEKSKDTAKTTRKDPAGVPMYCEKEEKAGLSLLHIDAYLKEFQACIVVVPEVLPQRIVE